MVLAAEFSLRQMLYSCICFMDTVWLQLPFVTGIVNVDSARICNCFAEFCTLGRFKINVFKKHLLHVETRRLEVAVFVDRQFEHFYSHKLNCLKRFLRVMMTIDHFG